MLAIVRFFSQEMIGLGECNLGAGDPQEVMLAYLLLGESFGNEES